MEKRKLENWLDSYIHYTRLDESPDAFHLWTGITVLSATLNRSVWMDRGYYRCFPNLYVLFIGPSGVGKSSASGIGIQMLQDADLKINIYKDAITSGALMAYMAKPESAVKVELGGKLMVKTPVLIYASELGNLLSDRTGIRELTLILTELFNKQGDHEDTTNKRGRMKIKKPIINFHACCFPDFIYEVLNSTSLRSGFFGRMMVVTAFKKRTHREVITLSTTDRTLRLNLINDLRIIGSYLGELTFDTNAYDLWRTWYHEQPLEFISRCAEIEGFAARKPQFVQRLAMIHSIARGDSFKITETDLRFAIHLVSQCDATINSLGATSEVYEVSTKVRRVLEQLTSRKGTVYYSILLRRCSKFVSKKRLDEMLEQLESSDIIKRRGKSIEVLRTLEDDETEVWRNV